MSPSARWQYNQHNLTRFNGSYFRPRISRIPRISQRFRCKFLTDFYVSRRGRKERKESRTNGWRTPTTHLLLRSNEPMKFAKAPRACTLRFTPAWRLCGLRSNLRSKRNVSCQRARVKSYSECSRSSTTKLLTRTFTHEKLSVLCVFARDKESIPEASKGEATCKFCGF